MSGFTGSYIRVLTPRTKDGINLMYEQDGTIAYKESHIANTKVAKEVFEKINSRLAHAPHLKHILEPVGEIVVKSGPKPNPTIIQEQVVIPTNNINRGKPGPKPKTIVAQ